MKQRLVQQVIEQRGDVGLDDEEEELLGGDGQKGGAEDGVGRVGPDIVADEVAVPRDGGDDGDGDEDGGLVPVASGQEGIGQEGEYAGERDGEFEVAEGGLVDVVG